MGEETVQLGHEPRRCFASGRTDCGDHAHQQASHDLPLCFLGRRRRTEGFTIFSGKQVERNRAATKPLLNKSEGRLLLKKDAQSLPSSLGRGDRAPNERLNERHRSLQAAFLEGLHHFLTDSKHRWQRVRLNLLGRFFCLSNHIICFQRLSEDLRRKACDGFAFVFTLDIVLHRGARADTAQSTDGSRPLFQASNQARHVGPSLPGIRMNLIKHKELEHFSATRREQSSVLNACQQQLKLNVIRDQDVGGRIPNGLAVDKLRIIGLAAWEDLVVRLQGPARVCVGITGVKRDLQPCAVESFGKLGVLRVR